MRFDRRAAPVLARAGGLMAYGGYVLAVNAAAAPLLAQEFGLDDAGIAHVLAAAGVGAVGTLALSRGADRLGRRRMVLGCCAALSVAALGSAAAPGLWVFVISQIAAQAFAGSLVSATIVVVAEHLSGADRARGQALCGLAGSLGASVPLLLAPFVPSWRAFWLLGAVAGALLPAVATGLTETSSWRDARARGETRRLDVRILLGGGLRGRALAVVASAMLLNAGTVAPQAWLFYYPVRTLGIPPVTATAAIIAGGALGLVGYPLGASFADCFGRRTTFALATVVAAAAMAAYFTAAAHFGALGLGAAFSVSVAAMTAGSVAFRAAVTELFPTALRGTVQAWLNGAGAIATVSANFSASALARSLGGIAPALTLLTVLCLGAAACFRAFLPETAGLASASSGFDSAP